MVSDSRNRQRSRKWLCRCCSATCKPALGPIDYNLALIVYSPHPRNFIGQSQSGTGKTAAFALNILSRLSPDMMIPQVSVSTLALSFGY